MAFDFSAVEIFEMAVQIEKNGAKFYRSAAENVADSKSKKLLTGLAEMEDDHEQTFMKLKAELADVEKQGTVFDPQGEAGAYIQALADTRVFFEKKIDLTSMREILKAAIEAEKDSIVFYVGMKEFVAQQFGRDRIDNIIKEEMVHIKTLARELVALKK